MTSRGLVQIVILNWNGYDLTRDCLISLADVDYSEFNVIVIDNASTDGSFDKLKAEFPKTEILRSDRNLGFSGGNNLAIEHSRRKYNPKFYLLLNNDTIVDPKFLENLVNTFFVHKNVGLAGNKIYYYDDPKRIWFAGGMFDKFSGNGKHIGIDQLDTGQFNVPTEINFISGCCLMIHRDVIEQIGLLDDNFFAYCEDVDYSLRAVKKGYKLYYVPDSIVYHKVSSSFKVKKRTNIGGRSALAYYLNVRNRIFLYRKHKNYIYALPFFIHQVKLVTRYLIGFLISLQFSKVRSVLLGIKDGIAKPLSVVILSSLTYVLAQSF